MIEIQTTDSTSLLTRQWRNRNSNSLLMGLQHDTTIWKTDSLTIFFKTALLLYDTAVMILGIYSNQLKTHVTQKPAHKSL